MKTHVKPTGHVGVTHFNIYNHTYMSIPLANTAQSGHSSGMYVHPQWYPACHSAAAAHIALRFSELGQRQTCLVSIQPINTLNMQSSRTRFKCIVQTILE